MSILTIFLDFCTHQKALLSFEKRLVLLIRVSFANKNDDKALPAMLKEEALKQVSRGFPKHFDYNFNCSKTHVKVLSLNLNSLMIC